MTRGAVWVLALFVLVSFVCWSASAIYGQAALHRRAEAERRRRREAWRQFRRAQAIRDAQQRNAAPAPRIVDFPRKSER